MAAEAAGSADYATGNGRWAFNAGGSARRSGDVSTPLGDVENTQARSAIGHAGGSWTADRGFLGASYQYNDSKYGVPVVEGGMISLTPRRHAIGARGQTRGLNGLFTAVKGSVNVRSYEHEELEGTEVGTVFTNDTLDGELLATTRPMPASWKGPTASAAARAASTRSARRRCRRASTRGRCRRSPTRKPCGRT